LGDTGLYDEIGVMGDGPPTEVSRSKVWLVPTYRHIVSMKLLGDVDGNAPWRTSRSKHQLQRFDKPGKVNLHYT
jgi:hypothetical protein